MTTSRKPGNRNGKRRSQVLTLRTTARKGGRPSQRSMETIESQSARRTLHLTRLHAHQLLLNGKPDQNCKIRNKKAVLKTDRHETMLTPFTIQDLGDAISLPKNGKAPGLDNIHHEMIKCFGPTTRFWLLDMLNDCLKQQQIPNVWRKSKVVALLKPGKDPESPKSYRPIALLCSLYKLLERMILTRLQCKIEHRLIPQQAGFRPGKSCCSQVLNLTQHIEDGFELGQITGAAFIDLTAAYDTINHRGGSLLNSL